MPFAAHARRISGFVAAGVHTNTRSIAPAGSCSMSVTVRMPRTSSPCRLVANTAPSYPDASRLWSDTKPNLPGCVEAPVIRTPFGSNRARNRSSSGRGRIGGCDVPGSPSSTSASTATGTPSGVTISGFTSTLRTSGRSAGSRPRPTRRSTRCRRDTGASPRNAPSSFWVASPSIISPAVTSSRGAGRNTTSATASARTPPTPSITVGPNCTSRSRPTISSRLPEIIGATSTPTSPSSGRAAARSSEAARSTAGPSARSRRTRPRSVLWAIEWPTSLATTG
jgi:hypothetical protein